MSEEICVQYERTYPDIQWDFYKEKYKKYCLNPENLVTINDFFEKLKNFIYNFFNHISYA